MGLISSTVDRLLHTTPDQPAGPLDPAALALHEAAPVVDLVVGTALFRPSLEGSRGRGHVDLPRLRAGGVNVLGLTLATRFPDLRGTLSGPHFRSLGMPGHARRSNMASLEWLVQRVVGWCEASPGELRLLRSRDDLSAALQPAGPIGIFLGVQGGHALDGRLANVERLRSLGVRMLAPGHVMDNAFVGSSTGHRRNGLSGAGRELIAELERSAILLDLAHMSPAGVEDCLALARRPPLISHAGLLAGNDRPSRWRRYSAATRNVPAWAVAGVARAGGVVGLILSTQLLGGETIEKAVGVFVTALDLAGPTGVAIGSDMDGGLRMVVDAAGLPRLTEGLLLAGVSGPLVRGILGGNALRLLESTFDSADEAR